MQKALVLLIFFAGLSTAQSTRPPVVFVRGYDFDWTLGFCTPSSPSGTFGSLPVQIQSDGAIVYGFDNCAAANMKNVPIETLGALFGQFLATIPAPQVDIVAHSMGGLIVRAYLAGLQTAPSPSLPPQNPGIRKVVFIATPHFGTILANDFGTNTEITEMAMGSGFLYNLARWNQGIDDLRGLDSLSIVGDAGLSGSDDGVVSLNSASLLSFGRPALRTRVLPYCHTSDLLILACFAGPIAEASETSTMVRSFLAGTNDWSTVGNTITTGTGANGGIMLTARDANDAAFSISSVTFSGPGSPLQAGSVAFFADLLNPGTYAMKAQTTAGVQMFNAAILPAQFVALLAKVPPAISAVIPSAGLPDARVVAPGALVSFYGTGLATSTTQALGLPFPLQLGGTSVTSGTTALPLLAVSDGQVNAYVPPTLSGLVDVTLKNSTGQQTITLLVAPASPALFSLDSSGSGPAAALHSGGSIITSTNPAVAGEYISLYATGLGATTPSGGLDIATLTPQATVAGTQATVTFAGRAPGFVGLDQINIQIPAGVSGTAVPVVVLSGGRTSNTVTLAIQ